MTSILNNFEICSEIPQNIKINIKSFYVFTQYGIIFVTKDDKVYGLGLNISGRLGLGHTITIEECTEIKELSKQKIKGIFNGLTFMLALNEGNHIFGWGENDQGQLGRGYKSRLSERLKPQKIDFPSVEKIIDISCGHCHTLVLLENGLVYGWGWNKYGQLGLNKGEIVNDPQIIEINENQEKLKYIYCHWNSSFAITTNGLIFSWGNNRDGILGQGVNEKKCIPRKVNLVNANKIAGDFTSSYFLTNEGSIYFCNKTQNTPKEIRENEKIFTDLEFNYCCDSQNMFYEMNDGEIDIMGKFQSFTELIAEELKRTSKIIQICDESENSIKCLYFLFENKYFNNQYFLVKGFQLSSTIGSGGFGKVYKYLNILDKQFYAIKTINSK